MLLYLILLDWSVPRNHNILVIFNDRKGNFDTSFKRFDYFDLKLFTVSEILIKYIQDYVTIILQIKIIWIGVNLFFRCERQLICHKVYEYERVREYSIYEVDLTNWFFDFPSPELYISIIFCCSKEFYASFFTQNAVLILNIFIMVSVSLWLVIHGQ